jgi:hypothetical protein
MALTRLDNLYSSKTGKYLYVSPDDFNATDELDNRGNSPLRPFKTIQRAFIEVARYSYLPGQDNDRFDQFSIMLMPGDHFIDNRPGLVEVDRGEKQRYFDAKELIIANRQEIIDRAFGEIAIEYDEAAWGTDWVVPGDPINSDLNRGFDSYRLIQKNRQEIVDGAFAQIAITHPTFTNPNSAKCQRDIGYFVDAVSLDVLLGGGNRYTRKFLQNYFNNSGTAWIDNGLQGEEAESTTAFNKARDLMKAAVANQLTFKDLTLTIDPLTGSNTNVNSCANIQTTIATLTAIVTDVINDGNLEYLPEETIETIGLGESKCKRDIGYIVDAVAADLANGGNANIVAAAKSYFTKEGLPISNGLLGEEAQSVIAFNAAKVMMKKAVTNQLYSKDLNILSGPAVYNSGGPVVPNLPSGNVATCVDVQATIDTLIGIITTAISDGDITSLANVQITGDIPVFNYNRALEEWQDNSILDLSNPDNVLYKFNASTGGAIVPRGCSLIGYDLRRTIVRPLYVPDPADGTQERTSIFNLTGGCYIWQFTIKDGDLSENSPLYDNNDKVGKVYFQKGNNTQLAIPEYSHHKITIMTYADLDDLDLYYNKVATAFALFQPTIDDGDLEALPQENRIVGPLSDTRSIVNIRLKQSTNPSRTTIVATTKIAHGYFVNQYVAIVDNGLNDLLNGTFKVTAVDQEDPRIFEYQVATTPAILGLDINENGYSNSTTPSLNLSARAQAEIDSVESASPYVFNCSIRSTWGQCGMWADGSKATGFKSMVVAQYTGVSLQRDDRAFIRYDEFSNTWNQASLVDAFATIPYHSKGDAYWKDDWRNFHIRASDDAFIQCVSVFAVGFFDHFLMESGGDMSITNSNSNFGNTSLHAVGFKGFSFNQDKGGYITDIIPVKEIDDSAFNEVELKYYSIALQVSKDVANQTKLYYGSDDSYDPFDRPSTSISGYRLGAKTDEKIYLKLKSPAGTTEEYFSSVTPNGFKKYTVSLETLNPDGISIDNRAQDASNIIETNKTFIQQEAYGYITQKYPNLLTNTNIEISTCERDIGYFVDAVIQDLRLGGNINTIQAAEGYYIGGQLAYISNELNETVEALDYVKNLCISTMRNYDYLIRNCVTTQGSAVVDIGDTSGILIGMKVTQYDYNLINFTDGKLNPGATPVQLNPVIPNNVYVKKIIDANRIELGNLGSKLDQGLSVPANLNSSSAYLYFELPKTTSIVDSDSNLVGSWAATPAKKDNTLVQDTSTWGPTAGNGYPECSGVATIIQEYFVNIFLILNQGLTPLGGKEVDASNLILANKNLIAEEAVDRMLIANPGFVVPGGNQQCTDDVKLIIDAIAYNIKYGGNSRVYDAARVYVLQPNLLNGERTQAVQVYTQVRDLAIQAMRNQVITIQGDHNLTQYIDNTVIGDLSGQAGVYDSANDCADIASTITTFNGIITGAIGTDADPGDLVGITRTEPEFNNVTRVEPVVDTANLASRATLFTVNVGGGTSNPHNFETGTAVRLVPKAREGTNPDKRVIRLPRGFQTNTVYYVIAPGRSTAPEDYSDEATYPNTFGPDESTKIMLARTKENAAAGIYIYSSETDSVDEEVEIELQQYVLDETYDLHQYLCNFITGQTDVIQTDVPHVFDVPSTLNTVHKVFFRSFGDPSESELPQITSGGITEPIDTNTYYYARFVTPKTFALFYTPTEAISGTPRITFTAGFGKNFYVFSDKRESPVKFDATLVNADTTTGQWYINTKNEISNQFNIIRRIQELGDTLKDARSKNTFYRRLRDNRTAQDRIYRLRYVIPEYAQGVRDPLNGFVLKARTDETRRLLPQKIVLAPVAVGSPNLAYFEIQLQQPTGGTIAQQLGLPKSQLDLNFEYDPYNINQVKVIDSDKTQSKVSFSIQSARQVNVNGTNLIELTVFDYGITNDQLRNEKFTTVKIDAPQGGTFRFNTLNSVSNNRITWSGFSAGSGYLQGYFNVDGTDEHYLIIKNIDDNKRIEYNSLIDTVFTQPVLDIDGEPVFDGDGNAVLIFASLQAKENSVGSVNNSLSKSDRKDYLYSIKDSNVLTITPGDIIEDDDSTQYRVISVEDAGQIEDSFYIFDIDEIQRRIPNQQAGIYYLTCLKGNISPFPTGPGVGTNFRNFKFSQPISQLYPLDYKNDPLWFQVRADGSRDTSIVDVPPTICAADNFVHGLVTTNDSKNSETKEVVLDFINNPALNRYDYVVNPIAAQAGNATSGSEDRLIPISGDSPYPTEGRLYVELRRPSIARSGNHTFEYLGFGPGNYSTGFPLRQEVVLSDIQDFYAQSKKEDGGIVFYTGLNSNGDLYIGNRKINAITGEETYLERAQLISSDDETDDLGGLVTTFELPVVFEKDITVDGNANFNNPVTINVEPSEPFALTVVSNLNSSAGEDVTLDSATFALSDIPSEGNIVLSKNNIYSAIFTLNPRGNTALSGQNYSIRTHVNQTNGNIPSNYTPNQELSTLGLNVTFGSVSPTPGDILLKGAQVDKTGSLGWIYSNFYDLITSNVFTVTALGSNIVQFTLQVGVTNSQIGITQGSKLKIGGFTGRYANLNGLRTVGTVTTNTFQVISPFIISTSVDDPTIIPAGWSIEISRNSWKEYGVLGAETLRTNTQNYGDFKLGINTVARAKHGTDGDQLTGFVSEAVDPRANLDIVGNAFISGRTLSTSPNNFINNPLLSNRTFNKVDHAFIVGFDPKTNAPQDEVVLRVASTTIGTASNAGGRIGINTTLSELDRNFVVKGNARITNDLKLESNLAVNGGSLTTTSTSFNILDTIATDVNAFSVAEELNIANITNENQLINIGNVSNTQEFNIGRFVQTSQLWIHSNSTNSLVDIGTVSESSTNTSIIRMGGAFGKLSNVESLFKIRNRFTEIDGNLSIGTYNPPGTGFSEFQTNSREVEMFSRNISTLDFATSVTRLNIGGAGGFTTINNTLVGKNAAEINGDITLIGGLNAGAFTVRRGSFGTPTTIHVRGNIDLLNVDIFKKVIISRTIDTQGLSFWGGTTYQVDPANAEDYFLPIGEQSFNEFGIGDYVLIDRSVQVTGQDTVASPVGEQYSELVQVIELTNLNDISDLPLRIKVKRARNALTGEGLMISGPNVGSSTGVYRYLRTDHPDNAVLVKYTLANDVSYIDEVSGLNNPGSGTVQTIATGVFSGSVIPGDILRFSDSELANVNAINQTTNQLFRINDGGNPATTVFQVDSTTGNTVIAGTLDLNKTFTLIGSSTTNQDRFVITNGTTQRFAVDSATGNTCIFGNLGVGGSNCDRFTVDGSTSSTTLRGGNLLITDNNPVDDGDGGLVFGQKLFLQNTTGNLTISGTLTTEGSGTSTFAGDVKINGGDLTVNKIVSDGDGGTLEQKLFEIGNDGSMDFAGVNGFFTPSGARKWVYVGGGEDVIEGVANVNYFLSPSADTIFKLPQNPTTGDMIRVVDVGGNLTYNISLRFRAPSTVRVQGDNTNSGQGPAIGSTYNGGELVVQSPNAALGLIYIGPLNYDGTTTGAPPSQQGWWLMEI